MKSFAAWQSDCRCSSYYMRLYQVQIRSVVFSDGNAMLRARERERERLMLR